MYFPAWSHQLLIPEQGVQLYEMAVDGRWEQAVGLQRALWDLNRVFAKYNLAACIKNRARIAGIARGKPSLSPGTPGPGGQRGNQAYPEKGKGLIALKGNEETSGSASSPDTPTELLFRERANGRRFERRLNSGNGYLSQGKGTHLLLAR